MSLKVGQCRHAASAWINNDLCSLLQSFLSNKEETWICSDSLCYFFQWVQKCHKERLVNWAVESIWVNTNSHVFQLVDWKSRIDKRASFPEVILHGDGASASHPVLARIVFSVLAWSQAPWRWVGKTLGRHPLGCLRGLGILNKVKVTCFQAVLLSNHQAFFRHSGTDDPISCICIGPSEQQPDRTHTDEVFSHLWC